MAEDHVERARSEFRRGFAGALHQMHALPDAHRLIGEAFFKPAQQIVRRIESGDVVARSSQNQSLRTLPAADIQDPLSLIKDFSQLGGNELLTNDVTQPTEPIDPAFFGACEFHTLMSSRPVGQASLLGTRSDVLVEVEDVVRVVAQLESGELGELVCRVRPADATLTLMPSTLT